MSTMSKINTEELIKITQELIMHPRTIVGQKPVTYLFNNYSSIFTDELLPTGKIKRKYLADVIQVLCAREA